MTMGCAHTKANDFEERYEVSNGRSYEVRYRSNSESDNKSDESEEYDLYPNIGFSSNESFSVSNEPVFENENDDSEISRAHSCVDEQCENEPMCLFLNRFRESQETYQTLHWKKIHILPTVQKIPKSIAQELKELSNFTWYWGPMSSKEAEHQLRDQPDGTFLVRDSANARHLLSVSFRSKGSCCHTRIQCRNKKFSLGDEEGKDTVIELIQQAMTMSKEGVLFYSRRKMLQDVWYPVRLLYPVSRMTKVPSLQFLCRFVIRRNIRCDQLHALPLPKSMIEFLHGNYFRDTI